MNKRIYLFCVVFFALASAGVFASAAELKFSSSAGEYGVSDVFKVEIFIDTAGQNVNAGEIAVNFDRNLLQTVEIETGGSVFSIWPQPPSFNNLTGEISLTGGVPGGFSGDGVIATVVFRAVNAGTAGLNFQKSSLFLNDGKGTKASVNQNSSFFSISSESKIRPVNEWTEELEDDRIPPEKISIKMGRDPAIFSGDYFLSFSAADKQSGIDYYAIKEGDLGWQIASSPYRLSNQEKTDKIYVKAVDKAGNERIEIFKDYSKKVILLFVLVAFFVLLFSILIILRRKKS
jgi:hypothetical protein